MLISKFMGSLRVIKGKNRKKSKERCFNFRNGLQRGVKLSVQSKAGQTTTGSKR